MKSALAKDALLREKDMLKEIHNIDKATGDLQTSHKDIINRQNISFKHIDNLKELVPNLKAAIQKLDTLADVTNDQEERLRGVIKECSNCKEYKTTVIELKESMDGLKGALKLWGGLVAFGAMSGTILGGIATVLVLFR